MAEVLRSETTGGIAGNWLWRQVEVGAITADEVDLYIAAGSQAGSRAPLIKCLESLTSPGRPRQCHAEEPVPEVLEAIEVLDDYRSPVGRQLIQQFYRRWHQRNEESYYQSTRRAPHLT